MKKYEELRTQYPEIISMDQLYRICKISKRSADYLIKHGVIPAVDTGRKTWRYRIALDDVIAYLIKRDKIGSMIPRGAATCRHGKIGERICYASLVTGDNEHKLAEYFSYIYSEYPDVITAADVAEMTGLSTKRVFQFIRDGELESLEKRPRYLISKVHLLKFVTTPHFIDCKSNSEHFIKILGGFKLWETAKS